MMALPWFDRVVMLQINPEAARPQDVMRMAEEYIEMYRVLNQAAELAAKLKKDGE